MAKTPATNYSSPGYSYATADADAFDRTDVAGIGASVDGHDHSTGKGLPIAATAIANGTITSAMIADGTITGTDIASGTITTTQIQDGTIATADLANAAVTNAKLGTDTARMSLLTNGGFEVWQRGAAGFTATGIYSADRWYNGLGGSSTFSVVQRESAAANVDAGSLYSLGLSYTHNAESFIFQKLEDFNQLKTRTITLSIRVRALAANMVRPFIQIPGGAGNVYGAYHSGGGAFETLTVTASGISTSTTAIVVGVSLMATGTAYVDNAMLVVGSVAADYAPLHPADDLARCLRYYETIGNWVGTGVYATTTAARVPMRFVLPKAVTPTITAPAPASLGVNDAVAPSAVSIDQTTTQSGRAVLTVSASTTGFAAMLQATTTPFTVEANP